MEIDGEDLTPAPLEERKARLRKVLARRRAGIVYNEHLKGDGAMIFQHACRLRAGNGALKLIAYDVAASGAFSRTGDSGDQAGAISEVSLVTPSSNTPTTALRNGSGNLELISWSMQG